MIFRFFFFTAQNMPQIGGKFLILTIVQQNLAVKTVKITFVFGVFKNGKIVKATKNIQYFQKIYKCGRLYARYEFEDLYAEE